MRTSLLTVMALTLAGTFAGCAAGGSLLGRKVDVRVMDEAGTPVPGARVVGSFSVPKTLNPFDGQRIVEKEVIADAKGACRVRGSGLDEVYVCADSPGYYRSGKSFTFGRGKDGRPQADEATIFLRLRKKIAPTAMYAKRLEYQPIPILDKPVGFDLLAGDWVTPYGKGMATDVVFTAKLDVRSRKDFDAALVLQFPNPGDGLALVPAQWILAESELLLPHEAPEGSFDVREIRWTYNKPRDQYVPKCTVRGQDWFLRVRTELDKDGRTVKAMYGKVPGEIALMVTVNPEPAINVSFTYYVNPDGTRNIEFDPERNLIPNALSYEKPTKP